MQYQIYIVVRKYLIFSHMCPLNSTWCEILLAETTLYTLEMGALRRTIFYRHKVEDFNRSKFPHQLNNETLQRRKNAWVLQWKSWLEYWDIEEEECHQDRKALNQHIGDYYRGEVWRKGEQRKKYYIDQFNLVVPR